MAERMRPGPLPSGVQRLWCVQTHDRQCVGGVTTQREFDARLGVSPAETVAGAGAAVAWVETRPLGPPARRQTLAGIACILQPVLAGPAETRSLLCDSEGEALIVLEAEHLRLVAEGWVEVGLDRAHVRV